MYRGISREGLQCSDPVIHQGCLYAILGLAGQLLNYSSRNSNLGKLLHGDIQHRVAV